MTHYACIYCGKPRVALSYWDLRRNGWVEGGPGKDYWICAECNARRQNDKESGPSPASPADPSGITAPDYYRIPCGAVQLWDVIATLGLTHGHASALEYVYRAGRKPGVSKADDLRKAVANLQYEIARLEGEEEQENERDK